MTKGKKNHFLGGISMLKWYNAAQGLRLEQPLSRMMYKKVARLQQKTTAEATHFIKKPLETYHLLFNVKITP
jgi:hypothetical protein